MHAAAINLRGGVSPRNTRLRGQSIIEYVLIAAVIGLVIVFAGPGVAGAIRNQFSQVTNTVDSGTEGDNFISAEEKAYKEAMKTVVNKEAKDWTLDEQKAAATDIAKNGTSSVVYAKAKAAMDAGTKFSIKLTNGMALEYRIVGINHDDLADGSGKAGLTFEAVNGAFGEQCINSTDRGDGVSWGDAELRQRMNSGDLWSLLPNDFAGMTQTVSKLNYYAKVVFPPNVETMNLNVFILSENEIYGGDGQYEYFSGKSVSQTNYANASLGFDRWTRTPSPIDGSRHSRVLSNGSPGNCQRDTSEYYVCPAWCF